MSELPSGTVTFLFSDVEGSTTLMERLGDHWGDVLSDHRRLLREAFTGASGREVDTQGDAFFFVFPRARDAVAAATAGQQALAQHEWRDDVELRVRMGIHTGEPAVGEEGYIGTDVVRAARISSAAHGGQVLVSETTRALAGSDDFRDLGLHPLKGLEGETRLHQLLVPGLPTDFDPPRTEAPPVPHPFAGRTDEITRRAESAADDLQRRISASVEDSLRDALPNFTLGIPEPPGSDEHPSRLRRMFRRRRGT